MKKQSEKSHTVFITPYITPETRRAIYQVAEERTKGRVVEIEKELEETLEQLLKVKLTRGDLYDDTLVLTTERKIGKTTALLEISAKWEIPVVYKNTERTYIEEMAREHRQKEPLLVPITDLQILLKRAKFNVVLKSEILKYQELRKKLDAVGLANTIIIGFEEV